jgi:hypothetical protein
MESVAHEDIKTQLEYFSAQIDRLAAQIQAVEDLVYWDHLSVIMMVEQVIERRRTRHHKQHHRGFWKRARHWLLGRPTYTQGDEQ